MIGGANEIIARAAVNGDVSARSVGSDRVGAAERVNHDVIAGVGDGVVESGAADGGIIGVVDDRAIELVVVVVDRLENMNFIARRARQGEIAARQSENDVIAVDGRVEDAPAHQLNHIGVVVILDDVVARQRRQNKKVRARAADESVIARARFNDGAAV